MPLTHDWIGDLQHWNLLLSFDAAKQSAVWSPQWYYGFTMANVDNSLLGYFPLLEATMCQCLKARRL